MGKIRAKKPNFSLLCFFFTDTKITELIEQVGFAIWKHWRSASEYPLDQFGSSGMYWSSLERASLHFSCKMDYSICLHPWLASCQDIQIINDAITRMNNNTKT
jgi:hypothetical protein